MALTAATGSPPLTRGIHIGLADENKIVGITPAYAGNTMGCIRSCLTRWDHPRLRGEYPDTRKKCSFSPGSPPLTRGIQMQRKSNINAGGITPAYAGNTSCCCSADISAGDHPRLRGEYYTLYLRRTREEGSPPLTRGIPHIQIGKPSVLRITPAYAGNTAP